MAIDIPFPATINGQDTEVHPLIWLGASAHGPPLAKGLSPGRCVSARGGLGEVTTTHLGAVFRHLHDLSVWDGLIQADDTTKRPRSPENSHQGAGINSLHGRNAMGCKPGAKFISRPGIGGQWGTLSDNEACDLR